MSWIRNNPFGSGYGKVQNYRPNTEEYDPTACFDSFRKHWQQISDIIEIVKVPKTGVKHDEILSVVSNLDFMIRLLLLELQSSRPSLKCLEYIMNENILEIFFTWSLQTGKYENTLIVEQLKLYEVLVCYTNKQLLNHDSFHCTLLKLLKSCSEICFSLEVEKRLVVLLNQLCVSFIHQSHLLYNFFEKRTSDSPKFIIFSLLIRFVHCEGTLGQQARDSLLLCIALSKQNDSLADYIVDESKICPVLATGLSSLYSRLPRKLNVEVEDWYCLTPDDVNDIPELATFMNSLEFCNASVQVAHPHLVRNILEFVYKGFLLPVMGPALLQNVDQELITATAYFDLFLRSLTEPALIYCFIKFILVETYDGQRLIDILIERINCFSKLCLVTLSFMQTLIELNCEDVMLELILKYLIPCNHIMESQKSRIGQGDPFCENTEKFLQLAPKIYRSKKVEGSLYGDYQAYLADARTKIEACAIATSTWTYNYNGENPSIIDISALQISEDNELEHPSLPLADDQSSGYESFARINEITSECGSGGEFDSPNGSEISSEKCHGNVSCLPSAPCIGPFLQAIFNKLENMLAQNLFINLQLTGLISRLAIYPQPLLRSFLLDQSFIFQPSIRSLYQVIGCLKQKIEAVINEFTVPQLKTIVEDCETTLLDRENRLVNVRKYTLQALSTPSSEGKCYYSSSERDSKRSFTSAFTQVFRKKRHHPPVSERKLENLGYSFRNTLSSNEIHSTIMCALLLSEWLKELAAITQEHSVHMK
ncbi:FHIP family protein AGAP011705 isoform X2 [Halyomorpha halys]|uniref:FHIP family protein AGAP011705 isoform X2 n=1 Tax=Halyomorpha halys TaxID=286706 RepID=UPI0006D50B77|nr:UPF0518 protein AGAP011705 [Halyomorpha halys]